MIHKHSVWWVILGFSLLAPFLLIVGSDFPFFGVTVSFILLATLIYTVKEDKTAFDLLLFTGILLLSLCISIRSNTFLTFLNIVSVLALGAFFVKPKLQASLFNFLTLCFAPITSVWYSLQSKNFYTVESSFQNIPRIKSISNILKGLGISFIVLIIIIPLLSSVNPIFNSIFTDYINIERIVQFFFPKNAELIVLRLVFFGVLLFFLPKLLSYANSDKSENALVTTPGETSFLLLPKILVSAVVLVFFITQFQLYFSSEQTLQQLGYTHSEYAREVFAQLTVVAAIIVGILYNDKNRSKAANLVTALLLIECLFLALMAFKSDFDYSSTWGFTQKRLWGFTGVIWLIGVLFLYTIGYMKELQQSWFVQSVVFYSIGILLAVNTLNFDYLIYHFRKSTTQAGVDYQYLSQLSSDARAYGDLVKQLPSADNKKEYEYYEISASDHLAFSLRYLQHKYRSFDIRTFNLSEYLQYLEIKDVKPENYDNQSNKKPYPEYVQPSPAQVSTPQMSSASPNALIGTLPDGKTRVVSKENYELIFPSDWHVVGGYMDMYELQFLKCSSGVAACNTSTIKPLASLSFKFPYGLETNLANHFNLTIRDWVKTTQSSYWYDARRKQVYPYIDEELKLKSSSGIMRNVPYSGSHNRIIYVPLRDTVVEVTLIIDDSVSNSEAERIYSEVRDILSTYTVL